MGRKKETDLAVELENKYIRWEHYKVYGGSDPFYADGGNMNLIRNHIISYKRQIEEKYQKDASLYPPIYYRELPPEVSNDYMANAGEIRDKAREALEIYLSDSNFQYLLMNYEILSKKEAEKISVHNVLGYVSGLAYALKQEDLVSLRRHAKGYAGYLESFADCAEKMKAILSNPERKPVEQQLTLFQYGLETGQCR